jgi:uncharacterized SAM-binding protein YcdF (DUF218 family)
VLRAALKLLVMPPSSLFLLGALGLLVHRRRPRLGKLLVATAVGTLFVLSLPIVSAALMRGLQHDEPLRVEALDTDSETEGVDAIVVLAADHNPYAPEYGGATIGTLTLERIRYAARLARQTGLPILTAGGPPEPGGTPLSVMMKEVLEEEFGVSVRWCERTSRNTLQNLTGAQRILAAEGLDHAYLVTHSWHIPRALASAETAGLRVTPAPTSFRTWPKRKVALAFPSSRALRESCWCIHEWFGRAWYALVN